MPKVQPGQTEEEYVAVCVPYVMNKEGATKEQALGKCYGMYRNSKKAEMKKRIGAAKEVLKAEIKKAEQEELEQKYMPELTEKAREVGGFESPEPGDLPEAGAKMLASVYAKCRADGMDKDKAAKIAWAAVRRAGYETKKDILNGLKTRLESIVRKAQSR